ncbi:MAG: PBP1A family penicillin-binding protein [Acetobacteraceae bacterium]|nr:PBP1A family penicillin-binding protein [Acetobacteraceae bacterium]MSP28868.1 PBP1A family penicillin-binding protein [Acetobacteraceae bacterium]
MSGSSPPGVPSGTPPTPPSRQAEERRARRSRSPFRWLGRMIGAMVGLGLIAGLVAGLVLYAGYRHYSAELPDVDGLRSYQPRVMSRVFASDASLIAELATERRLFVPLKAIPEMVQRAFISAEDQNFWAHPGIDPVAILRAVVMDLQSYGQGRRPAGASTITQQVTKNMLLDNSLSIARKAKELILAVRIENSLTKERILELYLNEIYLGLQAYGVAAAAQSYFNKSLDELSLAEAAFLAALPKAPNNYNPFRRPEAAKGRRDWVIDRMAEDRVITAAQAIQAKASPIQPAAFRRQETVPGADWFGEDVRRRLVDSYGADATTQGGLMVSTSLDPSLQAAADRALRGGLMAYDRKHGGWRGAVAQLTPGPNLPATWITQLPQTPRPPGMLSEWRLAVVLEISDNEARVSWSEGQADQPAALGQPHHGTLLLSDLAWARPVKGKQMGPPPRRMSDLVQPGSVVMVEPARQLALAAAAPGGKPPPRGLGRRDRVLLRQIPLVQGALVCIDVATGRVLAMVGGWSFQLSQFNRASQAQRQPGSAFKPFVYLTALQKGISPSQRFLDAPFVLDQGAGGRWRPGNFGLDFNGPVALSAALAKSLNLVTIRVADRVGMEAVAQTAIAFHVVDNMPRVLPAALGAVETTVLRMAGAYASIAAGGREVIPTLIDSVQDRDGKVIARARAEPCSGCKDPAGVPLLADTRRQIADPASNFQLITMMQGVVQSGTGQSAGIGLNRPIGGKTGTSQDFNDVWFGGFTADLAAIVWLGYDMPASLGGSETGGSTAAPIWREFMTTALKNRPPLAFIPPAGINLARLGDTIDAFKLDQVPGASAPLGENDAAPAVVAPQAGAGAPSNAASPSDPASAARTPPTRAPGQGGRVDGGIPGLY